MIRTADTSAAEICGNIYAFVYPTDGVDKVEFFINDSGIAWMAHVGGFVFGALIGLLIREFVAARHTMWTREYQGDDHGFWDNRHGGRIDDPTPPYGLKLPPYDGPVR